MDFLVFMGCLVIYLTEYLIQSYIAITKLYRNYTVSVGFASGYITIPPSTTKT
jgi:hypothetical protein